MYEAEIQKGAAFLDEQGLGWVDKIDLERLNLARSCDCVLGQLYGFFGMGIVNLGLYKRPLSDYGFILATPSEYNYSILTNEWKEYIKNRRTIEVQRV